MSVKSIPHNQFGILTPTDNRANRSTCHNANTYPDGHRVRRCANCYADGNSDCYRSLSDRAIHQLAAACYETHRILGSELPVDEHELNERIQKQIEIEAQQKAAQVAVD